MRSFAQKPKATQETTPAKSTIPGRAYFGQSREREVGSILHLQRTIGNQAVQRLLESNSECIKGQKPGITDIGRLGHDFSRIPTHSPTTGVIQTKLAINKSGDEYEQEADRIAAQVSASPARSAVSGVPPRIQRFSEQSTGQMDSAPASVNQALSSPGRPLEPSLQQEMEHRFGHDFSRVRVHSGAAAEQSVRDLNASAYTVGDNIAFGTGRFALGTDEGRRLLTHELTHVIQQSPLPQSHILMRAPATTPDKPPVPKPGDTPFNFISESPALENWKVSVKGMLEREFKTKFATFKSSLAADELRCCRYHTTLRRTHRSDRHSHLARKSS